MSNRKTTTLKTLHVVLEVKYLKAMGKFKFASSGVLTAVTMRKIVFWHETLYSLAAIYGPFKHMYCLHL